MKKTVKLLAIISYILFTQVYPVVHLHAQEHTDQFELKISVHPPEFSDQNNHHDDHEDSHNHEDTHFDTDCNYTYPVNTYNFISNVQILREVIDFDIEANVVVRKVYDIPIKIPQYYLSDTSLLRAPPCL